MTGAGAQPTSPRLFAGDLQYPRADWAQVAPKTHRVGAAVQDGPSGSFSSATVDDQLTTPNAHGAEGAASFLQPTSDASSIVRSIGLARFSAALPPMYWKKSLSLAKRWLRRPSICNPAPQSSNRGHSRMLLGCYQNLQQAPPSVPSGQGHSAARPELQLPSDHSHKKLLPGPRHAVSIQ